MKNGISYGTCHGERGGKIYWSEGKVGHSYSPSPEGFIYEELIKTLIEESLIEIEDIQDILQYNYNKYKRTSKSCYKKIYEKEYEKAIKEFNEKH